MINKLSNIFAGLAVLLFIILVFAQLNHYLKRCELSRAAFEEYVKSVVKVECLKTEGE